MIPALVLVTLVVAPATAALAWVAAGRRSGHEVARRTQLLVETVCGALEATEDTATADSAVRRIAEAVRGDAAGLGVVEGDRLWVRGMWNMRASVRHRPLGRGEAIVGRVWVTARPRVLDDLTTEPTHVPDAVGMRSGIYVPGISQGRVAVVLAIESHRRAAFNDDHVRLLAPVADLLAAVVDSRAQLRAAEKQEERLLASVGAELQSPLTTVLGNLTTLDHHAERLGQEAARELAVAGQRAASRIERLLDSLTLAGRLETGNVGFLLEPLPVLHLVAEAVERVRGEDGGATITVEPNVASVPDALGDRRQLRSVLVELIGNAVRHGRGAWVSVDATVDDGHVEVAVRDGGPGMPATMLDAVLGGIGRSTGDGGTVRAGLGLYLAGRLSEGMHGSLVLRSRPGHGTVAAVRLPVASA